MKRFTFLLITTLCLAITAGAQTNSGVAKEQVTVKIRGERSSVKEAMYVIDGKIVDINLNQLNPDQIESFSILKDASAIAKYGNIAENGVIEITTKNRPEVKIDLNNVIIRGNGIHGKNPLTVLDGKILDQIGINELDPNKIQSVTILKDASAIALYGKEAENGVIIIVTKKEEQSKVKN
ncbi:MAG: hypothetical protein EOP48_02150 [Sphingobacteriales bacterium]|nr:MAG: hypothetical protein EOP48_02150 [Sphingobacteriales bacterium]